MLKISEPIQMVCVITLQLLVVYLVKIQIDLNDYFSDLHYNRIKKR